MVGRRLGAKLLSGVVLIGCVSCSWFSSTTTASVPIIPTPLTADQFAALASLHPGDSPVEGPLSTALGKTDAEIAELIGGVCQGTVLTAYPFALTATFDQIPAYVELFREMQARCAFAASIRLSMIRGQVANRMAVNEQLREEWNPDQATQFCAALNESRDLTSRGLAGVLQEINLVPEGKGWETAAEIGIGMLIMACPDVLH